MHKVGKTDRIALGRRIFEIECEPHYPSLEEIDIEDRIKCPAGWELPTYELLQAIRNSGKSKEFRLEETTEYVQNPDISTRTYSPLSLLIVRDGSLSLYGGWNLEKEHSSLLKPSTRYVREVR